MRNKDLKDTFARLTRYGMSGFVSTGVDVAILAFLTMLPMWRIAAVSIAFAAGVLVNYYLHKRFTFRSPTLVTAQEFARFIAVVLLNYGVTVGVIEVIVATGAGTVMVGKLLSLPIVMAIGYTLTRRFVFRF